MIIFDTDVISYVLRKAPPAGLIRRIAALDPDEQATTSITVGELIYGAHRSGNPKKFLAALEALVWPNLRILTFDRKAAEIYGALRAGLEKAGKKLPEPDLRIGAITLRHSATLATGNLRHYRRIPDLAVEDWLAPYR